MKERIATGPVFESLLRVLSDFCVDGGTPGARLRNDTVGTKNVPPPVKSNTPGAALPKTSDAPHTGGGGVPPHASASRVDEVARMASAPAQGGSPAVQPVCRLQVSAPLQKRPSSQTL